MRNCAFDATLSVAERPSVTWMCPLTWIPVITRCARNPLDSLPKPTLSLPNDNTASLGTHDAFMELEKILAVTLLPIGKRSDALLKYTRALSVFVPGLNTGSI